MRVTFKPVKKYQFKVGMASMQFAMGALISAFALLQAPPIVWLMIGMVAMVVGIFKMMRP